jgi:LmbE family N-acetylglucosaminyl deacetylase
VELVVDEHRTGTAESEWASSPHLRGLPQLGSLHPRRAIVVAPHPDDEIFGAAGLMQSLRTRGVPVGLVVVSDGEASHPHAVRRGVDLRSVRRQETARALQRLGWQAPDVTWLGLPDGQIGRNLETLVAALRAVLLPGDLCLAPWWKDGHPDHDACGTAALIAAESADAQLLGYLVWAWHWADPRGADLPWADCRRLDFDRRTAARKRWATGAYVSQTRPLGPDREGAPLLPPAVLRRFWRPYEVFVDPYGQTR